MAQKYVTMNTNVIKQPDTIDYNLETTYREDATRNFGGVLYAEPLFTVEQFSCEWSHLTLTEMSIILQIVGKGQPFYWYCYSPYYGEWRSDLFRVGKGSLSIGSLEENGEFFDSLSLNITGDNPLGTISSP